MIKRAFNVKINLSEMSEYLDGSTSLNASVDAFSKKINDLLEKDNIDGDLLSNSLFDFENVDAFISYSHNDIELAKAFAKFLHLSFGFKVFIDCYSWKSSDSLLQKIDDKFCKYNDGRYDYFKRNLSTSHVHSMLSVAILKQISQSKLVFFLNTNNSVPTTKLIMTDKDKTSSPWIYEEMLFTNILLSVNKQACDYLLTEHLHFQDSFPKISYNLPMDNFVNISYADLCSLKQQMRNGLDSVQLFASYQKGQK